VDVAIFIVCRDRVKDLRNLVAWLEKAGHERICLLDNASTYEPLLAYLSESPHEVVYLGQNLGSTALWAAEMVPDEPFVYSDPDVLPIEDCPLDAVDHLGELLDRYPNYPKAGLGLYLDDVPEIPSLPWERELVKRELEPGVFNSYVDTTFALYGAGAHFGLEALRTGFPYQARHMPWYLDRSEHDAETAYYLDHAIFGPLGTTSWAKP
jgi:hypothetical protein